MTIQVDTREKARAIKQVLAEFEKQGVLHISSKLYVGDYMDFDNPRLVIDRKQNLLEVASNLVQQHDRFLNEIKRANAAGIKIIFLVEHGYGVKSIEDVEKWENPRLKESKFAISGARLYKLIKVLCAHHNVEFLFCDKKETGAKIIELLR
jgi:ERCC4-type nuclease